jgi:hypothetical protein
MKIATAAKALAIGTGLGLSVIAGAFGTRTAEADSRAERNLRLACLEISDWCLRERWLQEQRQMQEQIEIQRDALWLLQQREQEEREWRQEIRKRMWQRRFN